MTSSASHSSLHGPDSLSAGHVDDPDRQQSQPPAGAKRIVGWPVGILLGVVVLAWALLLTRHSGVFVAPAVLLAGWLGSASTPARVARVAAFAAALVVVPAAIQAENLSVAPPRLGGQRAGELPLPLLEHGPTV